MRGDEEKFSGASSKDSSARRQIEFLIDHDRARL
jgi:hypothetical protein